MADHIMRTPRKLEKIRLLHIAESAHGGVGTYLNEIVPLLIEQGQSKETLLETRLLLPSTDIHMIREVPEGHVVGYSRNGRSIKSILLLITASLREIIKFRPHIVHLHSTISGASLRIPIWLIRLIAGYPLVVYSPHGWAFQIEMSSLKRRIVILIELLLARLSSAIVTLSSRETAECISVGLSPRRLVKIYNGISERGVEPYPAKWDDARIKTLFVGRFDRQKGLDVLFDAVRPCPDEISVRCAGSSVVNDAALPDVPSNVELLGWMRPAQLRGHIQSADLVVVPSRWEGFGLVAVEAMRDGKMVIASNVGGLPEVVIEGHTGWLVPPSDSVALRAALLQNTSEQRKIMGEAGRQRFLTQFTSNSSVKHLLDLYRSILERINVASEA